MASSGKQSKTSPFRGRWICEAKTERVQPAYAKQRFPRSAALSQKAALPMITPSVIACGDAILPLLSLRATFPRRVKASAAAAKFPAAPKGSPLGELAR